MQTDFFDAHQRHLDDAEHLYALDRWANADHLYGLAGECGLKTLMLSFGMPFDHAQDRPESRSDRKHIDRIWLRYESYRSGHHWGAAYLLPAGEPFEDWKIVQRYANRSDFDAGRINQHRAGAKAVQELVIKAKRDGLL